MFRNRKEYAVMSEKIIDLPPEAVKTIANILGRDNEALIKYRGNKREIIIIEQQARVKKTIKTE